MKKISSKRDKTEADFLELSRIEFMGSLYLQDNKPCLPGELVEAALIESSKKRKRGPQAKAGVLIETNAPLIYEGPKSPDELWADENYRLVTGVRVQRNRIMRTRPIFREWSANLEVNYLNSLLNESEVLEFLKICGEQIGFGDWRPRFGRFRLE